VIPTPARFSFVAARLTSRLAKAGFRSPHAMAAFLILRLLTMVVPVIAICAIAKVRGIASLRSTAVVIPVAIFGYLLPTLLLRRRAARRKEDVVAGLPDFLDPTVVCLEGCMSLAATLQRVTEELTLARPSLGRELEIVQRDVALGTPLERAFRNFAHRTEIELVRTLASFIREAMRFGSEIAAPFAALR
jgi:tight adherence protein C